MQLDVEEARFQAAKRREAIERARALQLERTERMQGLKSSVVLSEVLRERDLQLKFAGVREKALAEADHDLQQYTLEMTAQAELKDAAKARTLRADAMAFAGSHIEHAAMKRDMRDRVRKAQMDEQAHLNIRATEFKQECKDTVNQLRQKSLALEQVYKSYFFFF